MTERQETINRVFAGWGNIYFSADEKAAIAAAHGPEVLAEVLAVYEALMDTGRGADGMDETFRRFGVAVRRDYPWISDEARGRLFHALMMNWK